MNILYDDFNGLEEVWHAHPTVFVSWKIMYGWYILACLQVNERAWNEPLETLSL